MYWNWSKSQICPILPNLTHLGTKPNIHVDNDVVEIPLMTFEYSYISNIESAVLKNNHLDTAISLLGHVLVELKTT